MKSSFELPSSLPVRKASLEAGAEPYRILEDIGSVLDQLMQPQPHGRGLKEADVPTFLLGVRWADCFLDGMSGTSIHEYADQLVDDPAKQTLRVDAAQAVLDHATSWDATLTPAAHFHRQHSDLFKSCTFADPRIDEVWRAASVNRSLQAQFWDYLRSLPCLEPLDVISGPWERCPYRRAVRNWPLR